MDTIRDKSAEAILDEASHWVVRMAAPDATAEEKRAFIAWLKRSPVHLGEYLRLERTWSDLGAVDGSRRIDVAALLAGCADNVVDLHASAAVDPSPVRQRRFRHRGIAAALAACFALVVAGPLWMQAQLANRYVTGIGEQRTVKLGDGSTVVLNTDTKVRVAFTDSQREVQLLEGEALFDVVKDPARPFRVVSDHAIAQAVGTSFIVRQKDRETIVTVIEGHVAVAYSAAADAFGPVDIPPQAVRLSAGVRADIVGEAIKTARVENPATVTAWRSGRLIFEGETLAAAVAEFNRYNELQLVLEDPQLSGERLSGVFDADQPQALVRFLERSGVIQPAQAQGETIRLVPQR